MQPSVWIYLAVMGLVTYAVRVLPIACIRRPIKSRFLRSFLYYVPYATLCVMTFPAILDATQSPVAGALALAAGIVLAWRGASLFAVSAGCCGVVFITELFLCR